MNKTNTLGDILKIKPTDAKLLLVLFACDLLRRISSLMLETASSSMFLYNFSGLKLPIVFMLSAVFMSLGAMHFIRIKKLPSITTGYTLIGMALITFMLYLLYFESIDISLSLLMIWKFAAILLSEITFLLVALRFCDYDWRSWKFKAILLTEAVAMIISGLAVTVLVYFVTPINLVLISSVLLLGAGFILCKISHKIDAEKKESSNYTVASIKNTRNQISLVSIFFAMVASFIIGAFFIDYVFYRTVFITYGEWLSDMTAFFAMYQVVAGFFIITLIYLFNRCKWLGGLKFTPLTLPFFLVIGAIACLTGALWVIAFACMGKDSFYRLLLTPIAKTFSVPLLPSLGKKLSAFRRILLEPTSVFIAGFILYHIEKQQLLGEIPFILILCALFVAFCAYISYRLYNKVVYKTLNNRYWWGGKLLIENKNLLRSIEAKTADKDVETSIYFLRVLEVAKNYNEAEILTKALTHPEERVRLYALSRLEALDITSSLFYISDLILNDESLAVRNRALQAYCVLGGEEVYDEVIPYLTNKDMQEGVAIGLLKGGIEGAFLASNTITELLDGTVKQKIQAANIIGKAKVKDFYHPLLTLLHDHSISVKKAAVIAAGKLRNDKFGDELLFALSNPDLREDADESLLKLGEKALPFLDRYIKDADTPISLKNRAINIIGNIGGLAARDILLNLLPNSSRYLRGSILKILASDEYRFKYGNIDIIHQCLDDEKKHLAWIETSLSDITDAQNVDERSCSYLKDALTKEISLSKNQIGNLQTLLNYYGDILPLLAFGSSPIKASDKMSFTDRLINLISFAPDNLHNWTLACAVYCAGNTEDKVFKDTLLEVVKNKDSLIRETAVWALGQTTDKEDLKEFATKCFKDHCPEVSRMAHFVFD